MFQTKFIGLHSLEAFEQPNYLRFDERPKHLCSPS